MFNFACWNIHGFSQEKLNNDHFYEKYDIFGLTETWTNKNSYLVLPGYRAITVHGTKGNRKKGRPAGGLIVYIKETLFNQGLVKRIKSTRNLIWLRLSKDIFNFKSDIFLCTIYIPPRLKSVCPDNDEIFDKLRDSIHEFSEQGKIILMGDFNARTGTLSDFIELDSLSKAENDLFPTNYLEDIGLMPR